MRPKITCHMITSIDGRLHPDRWSDPVGASIDRLVEAHYDATAARLGGQGWIVGRKTMADMVRVADAPDLLDAPRSRSAHIAPRNGRDLAVAIDSSGRLAFDAGDIDGDQAVAVLSERVRDTVLAHLRDVGVSYVFAGPDGHALGAAMEAIGEAFGVRHLILEGGGTINGAFLAARLIDEVSTLIAPAIDGLAGVPAIFEHKGAPDSRPSQGQRLELLASETLDGGVVWLRHRILRNDPERHIRSRPDTTESKT